MVKIIFANFDKLDTLFIRRRELPFPEVSQKNEQINIFPLNEIIKRNSCLIYTH